MNFRAWIVVLVLTGCGPVAVPTPKGVPAPSPTPARPSGPAMETPGPERAVPPVPAEYPLQEDRWVKAKLRPEKLVKLDKAVALFLETEPRYVAVEKMRVNGVPAPVVFVLHGRESTWNFGRHLHEGSPLTGRTMYVPKGRPLGQPPFTWEESAEDALYTLKHLERKNWSDLGTALQTIELYNGAGYLKYHPGIPSPYLWSGADLYNQGKYVADGKFDPLAVDKQLGCAAILKRMEERGVPVRFLP